MHRKPTSPRHSESGLLKGILAKARARFHAIDPRCYYCRRVTELRTATIDHKTPISRGGSKASRTNLALCCLTCNQAKADRTEAEFRAAMLQ